MLLFIFITVADNLNSMHFAISRLQQHYLKIGYVFVVIQVTGSVLALENAHSIQRVAKVYRNYEDLCVFYL